MIRFLTADEVAAIPAKKILIAIQDCDAYIAKEERRAADLRPADVTKRLDYYRQHRQCLIDALAGR